MKSQIAILTASSSKRHVFAILTITAFLVGLLIFPGDRRSREPLYGGKSLRIWVASLSSSDAIKSVGAINEIQRMGTNAIPLLIHLNACTSSSRLRIYQKRMISWLNNRFDRFHFITPQDRFEANYGKLMSQFDAWNIPILIDFLTKEDQGCAMAVLSQLGDEPVPYLIQLLSYANTPSMRWKAIVILGNIISRASHEDSSAAVLALSRSLNDNDPGVRVTAATFLACRRTSCELTVPVFIDAITNDDIHIRAMADFALTNTLPAVRAGKGMSVLYSELFKTR